MRKEHRKKFWDQMGIKLTLLQTLVGCYNHYSTKKSRDEQVICGLT